MVIEKTGGFVPVVFGVMVVVWLRGEWAGAGGKVPCCAVLRRVWSGGGGRGWMVCVHGANTEACTLEELEHLFFGEGCAVYGVCVDYVLEVASLYRE